jgi:N4-gp56 family major capsid protein
MAFYLNATADISTYLGLARDRVNNVNPEVFYSKQLLDTIRIDTDQYVYYKLADEAPIQEKADKLIIRRMTPLQGHTIPLDEGVPPKSDKGSVERYEMAAKQYGRYMEFTDKVDFQVVDPIIAHYTKEYSLVALETLDLLARETLLSIAQRFYASDSEATTYKPGKYAVDNLGGKHGPDNDTVTTADNFIGVAAGFEDLKVTSRPTMTDLRLIVLALKKSLVKPRMNGKYLVIGSSEFYFDMISDPIVEKYMRFNKTTDAMYSNTQLTPMFGLEFVETLCVPTSAVFVKGGVESIRMYNLKQDGTYEYKTLTAGDANTATTIKVTTVSDWVHDARTGADASYIPNQKIWDIDAWCAANNPLSTPAANWTELKAQHILVVGKDALTRTGLAGEGQAKMYVKQKGSTGVLDPIDQRQSIGFKINSVGFGSTRLEAVQDYICVPSQVNPL